jgi:hypothetical protein
MCRVLLLKEKIAANAWQIYIMTEGFSFVFYIVFFPYLNPSIGRTSKGGTLVLVHG